METLTAIVDAAPAMIGKLWWFIVMVVVAGVWLAYAERGEGSGV